MTMDITRGSLDEISRPASSSRINHGSKVLSASLEILTPEPDLSKGPYSLDFYNNGTEDNSKGNNNENGEECGTKKMRTSEELAERKTNSSFQLQIQNANQVKEYISRSGDSDDDYAENISSSCSIVPQEKVATLQTGNSSKLEDSKERDVDPLLEKAIKKMKRLDQILANKQSQERAVKKQGREMRTKLWEDFQSMTSRSSSVTTEEVENTSRFLVLTSPLQEPPDSSVTDENEMFISVFHTQILPESYEHSGKVAKQDCLNEDRTRSSIKKTENMHHKNDISCKKIPDFIKKNIELAKDSGNQVVMLEEEKNRLSELLKDTEDASSELQVIEEEATGWLVPGEGYTPEPMEYHHLAEINAKLQLVISDPDLSAIQSPCLKVHKQMYQESLAYANRKLETVPGEKVLRDTKDEREQQNRLKEIDQQLKHLEGTLGALPCLSEEQLNALLEECTQSHRTVNILSRPQSQGFLLGRMSAWCDTAENMIPDSRNNLLHDAHSMGMLTSQEMVGAEDKDVCSKEMMETSDCNRSKALVESNLAEKYVTEKKENDNPEGQEKTARTSNSEDYFMSIALSTDRPKKPSFLDEPFDCVSANNELSTDVDIPCIPLKTRGDELKE